MGSRDVISTALGGHHDIGIGDGGRGTGMAIDNLITGLHRTVRSYEYFQFVGDITSSELTDILRVNRIS
jgi:hypothetical protein